MRVPVEPKRTYRLINHGPTTLVTAAAGGRVNVMAAAWVMALDFDPPKIAAVIDGSTFTRELVDASGELTLSLPTRAMADQTWAVGKTSGRDLDKASAFGLTLAKASVVAAPFVEGCAAWLECRVIPHPEIQKAHDLFVAEVVAAWADDELFDPKAAEWRFPDESRKTIHHLHRGIFFATGERFEAKDLPPRGR